MTVHSRFLSKKKTDDTGISSFSCDPNEKIKLEEFSKRYLVVTSINAENSLVRTLELKLKKQKDIDDVFLSQVEPILPYPIENGIVDKLNAFQDKELTRLTVLSVRKDHLEYHIKEWNTLGLEPEVISADPQALAIFATRFVDKKEPFYVLHLGIRRSLCILIEMEN